MTLRSFQIALIGALSALGGCVVAPPPPMAVAQYNCRQFTQAIIVGGNSQPGYGVECIQSDGTWQIVAPAAPTPPAIPAVAYSPSPPYAYDPYYYGSPWYFGPEIGIGVGVGRGWHGGGWRR